MKRILITGANSYIGTFFEQWLKQWPDQYFVDTIDMIDGTWKEKNFSRYDVVFHVAGIAHVDNKKADKETEQLYYRVNRDLVIDTAQKAKKDGVKQFVFMSSSIVFGESSKIGETFVIHKNTVPTPSGYYGDSKLQADNNIHKLQSDCFHVVSMRPPMIYGKGCKGNYRTLSKFAKVFPIFPMIKNERSMLHIENLCECIRIIINNDESGFFYPQNREYVTTALLVKEIRELCGKKMVLVKLFNPILRLVGIKFKLVNKVFGSYIYDKEMSNYKDYNYCVNNFKESIKKTEDTL